MKRASSIALCVIMLVAVLVGCQGGGQTSEASSPASETPAPSSQAEVALTSQSASAPGNENTPSALDGYPNKVVQFIVVRGAGGGTDSVARTVATELEGKLGQPVVVMNVEGGDGLIGANEALNAEPDGYTLVVLGSTEIPNLLVNSEGVKFTVDDIKPICQLAGKSNILLLKKGSQFSTIAELVEYGQANPGKITIGVAGGNNTYIGLQMAEALGFEATIVNCNNGNELYAQVLGGHIECAAIGTQFYQNAIDEGMTVLGDTENRTEDKEGAAPSFVQQGYDLVIETFTYLAAPASTPDEICQYMSESIGELMEEGLMTKIDEVGQGGKYMPMNEIGQFVAEYNQKMIETYEEIKAAG